MIVLEDIYQESLDAPKAIQVLGIGLVSMTKNRDNIVFNKGISRSLMKDLIKLLRFMFISTLLGTRESQYFM